jgi:hypothetical protein
MVILLAHSGVYSEMAVLFFVALLGPALVAWRWPGDTAPALAAAAVFLPGLLLIGNQETFDHKVPLRCFLLAGLAPFALAPLTVPRLGRKRGWITALLGIFLPLIPAAAAVILAAQFESLDFEEPVAE